MGHSLPLVSTGLTEPTVELARTNTHAMQSYKRQQRNTLSDKNTGRDETTSQLQTLGMRIRQSIYNGYKLPTGSNSMPVYMNNYEEQQLANSDKRVALPSHLTTDGPPALDYNGSTASSLSCWESEINQPHARSFQNIDSFYGDLNGKSATGMKRGIQEVEDKDLQVNDYIARYGPLSFNEEF